MKMLFNKCTDNKQDNSYFYILSELLVCMSSCFEKCSEHQDCIWDDHSLAYLLKSQEVEGGLYNCWELKGGCFPIKVIPFHQVAFSASLLLHETHPFEKRVHPPNWWLNVIIHQNCAVSCFDDFLCCYDNPSIDRNPPLLKDLAYCCTFPSSSPRGIGLPCFFFWQRRNLLFMSL